MYSLHEAAARGDLRRIAELLERGAKINARDYSGWTPLHYAAAYGQLGVARFLVEMGAEVDAKGRHGRTPLHEAAAEGHPDVISFLLEKGANIMAQDDDYRTPLHLAAEQGRLDAVRLLIEKGADVNARDIKGCTPLHLAAERGHLNACRLLIESGADVNAKDVYGRSPLYLAVRKNHLEVARFLLEAGAAPILGDSRSISPLRLAPSHELAKLIENRVQQARERSAQPSQAARAGATLGEPAQRPQVAEHPAPSGGERVSGLITSFKVSGLVEGEWGVLQVGLSRPSRIAVEGDVEWLNPGVAGGLVELPVKAKRAGRLPIAIVARSGDEEERRIIWIEVAKGECCPRCGAPIEPGAGYCWKCGAELART